MSRTVIIIIGLLAVAQLGCDEGESDPCEDMSSFSCDCMTDTDEPIGLEEGLAIGCDAALEHFRTCLEVPGADENIYQGVEAYQEREEQFLMESDLCDGHGLEEMPGGCMSQSQLKQLLRDLTVYDCSFEKGSGPDPASYLMIADFKSWKRIQLYD